MLKHLQTIITHFGCVPNRLQKIVSEYIMFLILDCGKHELRTAAKVFGTHEANYSRLLSNVQTRATARNCLNRAIRRRLVKVKSSSEVFLIVDATFTHRSGKKVKNRQKFRHGGPYIEGHQFTNFVLFIDDEIIPLASVPFYSKAYCREIGIHYRTEIELVTTWIEMLPESGLLPATILKRLHFLLDTGYDAKSIQNAISEIDAKFTAGITSERNVNGLRVKEYFQRHRHIPWRTIRLKFGNSQGKTKERRFRVRSAGRSHLKGFGEVNVVCSEKTSRNARKVSRKYIVTNDLRQSARKTVRVYAKRWAIETWHKVMKQKFGYGDCRSQVFHAIEAHINFALCAYCLSGMNDPGLPRKGTTLDQYRVSQEWRRAAKVINFFDGRKRLKTLANEEIARIVNG